MNNKCWCGNCAGEVPKMTPDEKASLLKQFNEGYKEALIKKMEQDRMNNEELVYSLIEALLDDDVTGEACGDIIDKIIARMDPAFDEDIEDWKSL